MLPQQSTPRIGKFTLLAAVAKWNFLPLKERANSFYPQQRMIAPEGPVSLGPEGGEYITIIIFVDTRWEWSYLRSKGKERINILLCCDGTHLNWVSFIYIEECPVKFRELVVENRRLHMAQAPNLLLKTYANVVNIFTAGNERKRALQSYKFFLKILSSQKRGFLGRYQSICFNIAYIRQIFFFLHLKGYFHALTLILAARAGNKLPNI